MAKQGYWQKKIGRRRALQGAALGGAGLAAASLIACNNTPSTTTSGGTGAATTQQAKRGGVFTRKHSIGASTRPLDAGVDPHPLQANYTSLMTQFYQTLAKLNPRTAEIEPELAQRWEQPSQNEFVLHLQPGVKWHDKPPANGRELTAQDVVFSLNRVRTDDPRFQNRLLLSSIDKIDAVDKATVRVTTKEPDVSTMLNLAAFSMAIVAPEVIERAAGKFATADQAVGTGAFILDSLDDVSAVVVRNPNYWKPGLPYLDSVRNQYFADDQTAYPVFLSGQLDEVGAPGTGPECKKLFDEQEGKPYYAEWFKDVSFPSVQANTRKKPFDDARVSRALRLLVDHDEAVNQWAVTWFGRGYLGSVLPAALEEWDFTEQEYLTKFTEFKKDKTEAVTESLRLLNAAGFTRDNPLRFTQTGLSGSFAQAQAELHQAQFNRLGQGVVNATELRLFPLAQVNNVLAQGDFEYYGGNVLATQPYDPGSWVATMYATNAGRNYGKMSDTKLDDMLARQRTIFDPAQRKAAVKEMLTYMIENSPYTSWSGRYVLNLAYRRVKNWAPEGASAIWGYNYENVWLDV